MTLRSHLVALVVVALLPVLLFAAVMGDVLGEETRRFLEETRVLCVSKPFDLEQVRRVLEAEFRRTG